MVGIEYEDSDDGSIQGSPLLETKPTFSSALSSAPSHHNYPAPTGPPTGPLDGPGPSIATVPSMARGLPSSPPRGPPTGPPTGPLSGPVSAPLDRPSSSRKGPNSRGFDVGLDIRVPEPAYQSSRPLSAPTGPLSGPPLPSHRAENLYPVQEEEPVLTRDLARRRASHVSPEVGDVHSGLQFSSSHSKPRPYSMLLRSSFEPDTTIMPKHRESMPPLTEDRESQEHHQDQQDDDALPFEATKQLANKGRPQSSMALPSLATGIVMSKDKFESYRKSLTSLDMLQRQDSVAEAGPQSPTRSQNGANDDEEDAAVDKEEETTEKERKKQLGRQRQQQDARMSVYRQRMSKIIGGQPLPPSVAGDDQRSMRNPLLGESVTVNSESEDDEDDIMDDIPLTILRAHGFPRSSKRQGAKSVNASDEDDSQGVKSPQNHRASTVEPLSPGIRSSMISTSPFQQQQQQVHTHPQLATRYSQPSLPAIFGDKERLVSRGLVAEIAKEEDAKLRRQSMPFGAYGHLLRDGSPESSVSAPPRPQTQIEEIQSKLQAVLDAQIQLMGQLGQQGGGGAALEPAQMRMVPPQGHTRAPSVYSTAASAQTSAYDPQYANQFGNAYGYPTNFAGTYPETVMSLQVGDARGASSQQPVRLGPQPHLATNRPSMMRIVPGTAPDEEDDDDDDDEWQELLVKRQALRNQWKAAV